jgi:putative transposase
VAQIGHRYRCYPTHAQAQTLLRWIGCQRFIYNAKVGEDRYFRRFARSCLALTGHFAPIDQQYSHFKTDLTPWLFEVPSQVLRNGAVLWKAAYGRYFQKLGGRPTIHKKQGEQSVWLTSELFEFRPVSDPGTGKAIGHELHLGTCKFKLGHLDLANHRIKNKAQGAKEDPSEFKTPASIHISLHAGHWHVSFNSDDGKPEPDEADTLAWLMQHTERELSAVAVGLDRGVALPLASSDGASFGFTDVQRKRLSMQERHKKRWQKRQARRTKGSKNWVKAKAKVARYQRYGADVRRDVAHKTSHTLASDDRYKLFVFEALKVQNMTKKAKPKQDEQSRWLRNGAAAKSGLNKAILASTWGQTQAYLQYKARRRGKLVIEVPAFYTSQECAACGHIHKDNRVSQSGFVCQCCGHKANADHNAARVIAARGVRLVLGGAIMKKPKKACRITKRKAESQKVGAEISEPLEATQATLGETEVRRVGGNASPHRSMTQETPATALA